MRSAALLALGLWIGLVLASWVFATTSFRTVDRVLGDPRPELQDRIGTLPAEVRRTVFRHAASEANRSMFRTLSAAELLVAVALTAVCWRLGPLPRALALGALAVMLVQAVALGPAILDLGRAIDFVPRPLPAEVGRRFGLLHAGYMLGDLVKAAALVTAAWITARQGP